MTVSTVFTVGHSTHNLTTFLELISQNRVTAIADVRSVPLSRFTPQFNRNTLTRALREVGIKYVFMGKQLGARTDNLSCYVDGQVQYGLLARTPEFIEGVQRILEGIPFERIAIMCTEREPLECHRTVLVARALADGGATITHIHGDGELESHDQAMNRLMSKFGLAEPDLFRTYAERLQEALNSQERNIAYVNEDLRVSGLER